MLNEQHGATKGKLKYHGIIFFFAVIYQYDPDFYNVKGMQEMPYRRESHSRSKVVVFSLVDVGAPVSRLVIGYNDGSEQMDGRDVSS